MDFINSDWWSMDKILIFCTIIGGVAGVCALFAMLKRMLTMLKRMLKRIIVSIIDEGNSVAIEQAIHRKNDARNEYIKRPTEQIIKSITDGEISVAIGQAVHRENNARDEYIKRLTEQIGQEVNKVKGEVKDLNSRLSSTQKTKTVLRLETPTDPEISRDINVQIRENYLKPKK